MKRLGVILFVLLAACGKRGDPRPPVPMIPKATSDLVVTQRGAKVILSWSYPSLTTAGQSLKKVRRVVVYRTVEEPPAADAKAVATLGELTPIETFARVPALSPTRFTKLRTRVDEIDAAGLPSATAGAKLVFEDTPAIRTQDGRPVRLTYAVVTETESARSAPSNFATIVPLAVTSAPASFTATAKPEGVVLEWAPVEGAIAGYNVYREPATAPPDAFLTPVNPAPVTATTYTDVPSYGEYTWTVRVVASAVSPLIESDPTVPARATFKDLLPPPAPTNLNTLVEPKTVRLVWDPVSAADLKGYVVYRSEAGIKLRLTPYWTTASNFIDISIDPGIEYTYLVTSLDASGNESAPATVDHVMVPKTP